MIPQGACEKKRQQGTKTIFPTLTSDRRKRCFSKRSAFYFRWFIVLSWVGVSSVDTATTVHQCRTNSWSHCQLFGGSGEAASNVVACTTHRCLAAWQAERGVADCLVERDLRYPIGRGRYQRSERFIAPECGLGASRLCAHASWGWWRDVASSDRRRLDRFVAVLERECDSIP
ncbi:MAG: hypothetical protein RL069_630 [Planctomycetota bacterium]